MLRRAITTAPRVASRITLGRHMITSTRRFQNQAPLVLRRNYHEKDTYTFFPLAISPALAIQVFD